MRTFHLVVALVSRALVGPALTGGAMLAAQAVERTDVPARGILRVTFDPRIMTWNDEFTDAGRRRLGFGLTGDTVGSRYIPALAALEQNVRTVTGESNGTLVVDTNPLNVLTRSANAWNPKDLEITE